MNNHASLIQDFDVVDVIGNQQGGGVDLVVICSGSLDGSPGASSHLSHGVRESLSAMDTDGFRPTCDITGEVGIFLSCERSVLDTALALINGCEKEAMFQHVQLSLVKNVA